MSEFRDLTTSAADLRLLSVFYHEVYVRGFPDPDERESLENMQGYLQLKSQGWYGANNYHILLALQDGRPIACSISDYLAEANAGVIEFLLVDPAHRGQGLGRQLHDATEHLLQSDAHRDSPAGLSCIAIEVNDPFRISAVDDNMDPVARMRLWGRWGYGVLGFDYVQPALSADQAPVTYLRLGAKPLSVQPEFGMPATLVRQIVVGYLRWAMRIDDPEDNPTFQSMANELATRDFVSWTPFSQYLENAAN